MIFTAKCNVMNCNYNSYGWCDTLPEIDEDGWCDTKQIDYNRCSTCGCELEVIKEPYEYQGHEILQDMKICPECKE